MRTVRADSCNPILIIVPCVCCCCLVGAANRNSKIVLKWPEDPSVSYSTESKGLLIATPDEYVIASVSKQGKYDHNGTSK